MIGQKVVLDRTVGRASVTRLNVSEAVLGVFCGGAAHEVFV